MKKLTNKWPLSKLSSLVSLWQTSHFFGIHHLATLTGSGGREAALALAISRSKIKHKLFNVGSYANALMVELGE